MTIPFPNGRVADGVSSELPLSATHEGCLVPVRCRNQVGYGRVLRDRLCHIHERSRSSSWRPNHACGDAGTVERRHRPREQAAADGVGASAPAPLPCQIKGGSRTVTLVLGYDMMES